MHAALIVSRFIETYLWDLHAARRRVLIALANQRAQLAKDAITKDGKVALDRVYLLAPKLDAKGDEKRKGSRVDFALR